VRKNVGPSTIPMPQAYPSETFEFLTFALIISKGEGNLAKTIVNMRKNQIFS
jgi:hypothetical protein